MGRSRAVRPTREQKILMAAAGLVIKNWLVLSDTASELRVVSRGSGRVRTIKKDLPGGNRERSNNKKFHIPIIQGNRRKKQDGNEN